MYKRKPHILFLSTDNTCGSIIAEAYANELATNYFMALSAGIDSKVVGTKTIATMKRIGIDISNYKSEKLSNELLHWSDTVITMSALAKTHCPILPKGTQITHWPIIDANTLLGTELEISAQLDAVRNDIKSRVRGIIGGIKMLASSSR